MVNLVSYQSIVEKVKGLDTAEIIDLFHDLLSIDTSNPPGLNYDKFADVLEPHFRDLGFEIKRVIVPEEVIKTHPLPLEGPRVNFVASWESDASKAITFYAHADVVPAGDASKWKAPPFVATKKGRKIIGRGSADMKGSLATLILALRIMKELGLKPNYDMHIVACTDEEIGIIPGVEYLYEKGFVKGEIWCMEGAQEPLILLGAAGTIDFYIETNGKSCHSGTNFLGINALEETIPILNELYQLKKKVEKRESKMLAGPPMEKAPSNRLTPMFNIDMIQSGIKSNIVPDKCQIVINRRYLPDEKETEVIQELEEAVKRGFEKSKLLDYSVEHHVLFQPFVVDPKAPTIQKLRRIMQHVKKVKPLEIGLSVSTDMGTIYNRWNRKDIIFRGIGNATSNAHSENESVLLSDVRNFILEVICYLTDMI